MKRKSLKFFIYIKSCLNGDHSWLAISLREHGAGQDKPSYDPSNPVKRSKDSFVVFLGKLVSDLFGSEQSEKCSNSKTQQTRAAARTRRVRASTQYCARSNTHRREASGSDFQFSHAIANQVKSKIINKQFVALCCCCCCCCNYRITESFACAGELTSSNSFDCSLFLLFCCCAPFAAWMHVGVCVCPCVSGQNLCCRSSAYACMRVSVRLRACASLRGPSLCLLCLCARNAIKQTMFAFAFAYWRNFVARTKLFDIFASARTKCDGNGTSSPTSSSLSPGLSVQSSRVRCTCNCNCSPVAHTHTHTRTYLLYLPPLLLCFTASSPSSQWPATTTKTTTQSQNTNTTNTRRNNNNSTATIIAAAAVRSSSSSPSANL